MSPSLSVRNEATLALAGLQRAGTITSYRTNFMLLAEAGVTVTIPARDELAIERVRRSVQRAIEPHIRGAQVVVVPGMLAVGNGDRFDFDAEDDEEP